MTGSNFINRVTRRLKQRYGQPITFRKKSTNTTDYTTGVQTVVHETREVKRAIVIEQNVKPEIEEDLSYIASNRPYTYDALFDVTVVRVIVDRSDLAGFDLRTGHEFQWHGHVHAVSGIRDFEEGRSVIVSARSATGEPSGRVHPVTVASHIRLEQDGTTDAS